MLQNSHIKSQIVLTMAHSVQLNIPLATFNYYSFDTNCTSVNKIHSRDSEIQTFKMSLENECPL